jgi:hypothetical protein
MKVSDSMGEFENWNRFLKQTLGEKYRKQEKGQQSDRARPPQNKSEKEVKQIEPKQK